MNVNDSQMWARRTISDKKKAEKTVHPERSRRHPAVSADGGVEYEKHLGTGGGHSMDKSGRWMKFSLFLRLTLTRQESETRLRVPRLLARYGSNPNCSFNLA